MGSGPQAAAMGSSAVMRMRNPQYRNRGPRSGPSGPRVTGGTWFQGMNSKQREEVICSLQEVIKIPDGLFCPLPRLASLKMTPWYGKNTLSLPYGLASNTQQSDELPVPDPRPGYGGYWLMRSVKYPYWLWTFVGDGDNGTNVMSWTAASRRSNLYDFFNASIGVSGDQPWDVTTMITGVGYGVHAPWENQTLQPGVPILPVVFEASDGTFASGIPCDFGYNGNYTVNLRVACLAPEEFTTGCTFSMRPVGVNAVGSWVVGTALGSGSTTYANAYSFGFQSTFGEFGCCFPDSPLGLQIRCDTQEARIFSVQILRGDSTGDLVWQMVPQSYNSFEDAQNFAEASSTKAGTIFASYTGSTLDNAGSGYYWTSPGGQSPLLSGVAGRASIAKQTGYVQTPLKLGGYQPLKAYALSDFDFRQNEDLGTALSSPITMGFFNVGNWVDQTSSIELTFTHSYESTTSSQTRNLLQCFPNPNGLQVLIALLSMYPDYTENPKHLKNIKDFLSRVVSIAGSARDFYEEHKSWINPALAALGAAFI
jgi:hypothetical protein